MRRRDIFTLLGGAAAWPVGALAQQSDKLPRIGSIHTVQSENSEAFFEGLREAGYLDGQNALLEARYSGGALEGYDKFARELVALNCNVIFASSPYAVRATMKATNVIPIVGVDLEDDPIASGWAQNLARPGGNFTGIFLDLPELGGKQIEFLREGYPQFRDWRSFGMQQSVPLNSMRRKRRLGPQALHCNPYRSNGRKMSTQPSNMRRASKSME